MKGKRGAISTDTIIYLAIGALILVLVVAALVYNWGGLSEKLGLYGGGSTLDAFKTACDGYVSLNARDDFCCKITSVKRTGGDPEMMTCDSGALNSKFELVKVLDCKMFDKTQCAKALYCNGYAVKKADCNTTIDKNAKLYKPVNGGEFIPIEYGSVCCLNEGVGECLGDSGSNNICSKGCLSNQVGTGVTLTNDILVNGQFCCKSACSA